MFLKARALRYFSPCAALPLAIAAGCFATNALAKTCVDEVIEARGEEAAFQWLAKVKTRANWRRKVRTTTSLGPDYANWYIAADTEERCLSGPAGTVCTFTGRPCKN